MKENDESDDDIEMVESKELLTDKSAGLDDEQETEDIEDLDDLMGEYILEDIKTAIYDARFVAPLMCLLALVLAYFITIHPYRYGIDDQISPMQNFHLVRPVLTKNEQDKIQVITANAETHFILPLPSYDTVTLKYQSFVDKHGVFRPPELFHHGVLFGLTAENPYDLEYTAQSSKTTEQLIEKFNSMHPAPTSVIQTMSNYTAYQWSENGIAVYYSYDDLEKQGKLSSDVHQPWKRILDDVLVIARDFKQIYVTLWYPHTFGLNNETSDDPHRYTNIIREIIPTRTGYHGITSSLVVWMTHTNFTALTKPPTMIRKAWTLDDHWSDYLPLSDEVRAAEKEKFKRKLEEQEQMAARMLQEQDVDVEY